RLDDDAGHRRSGTKPLDKGGDGIGTVRILGATAPMPRRLEARTADVDADETVVQSTKACHGSPALVVEAGAGAWIVNRAASTCYRPGVRPLYSRSRRGPRFRRSSKTSPENPNRPPRSTSLRQPRLTIQKHLWFLL